MTLDTNQFEGVRIRLPMESAAVAAVVLVGVLLLAIASRIVEANGASSPAGARSMSAAPASNEPDSARLLADRGRPGRRF
ncbi:hypothetical protein [Polyangium sp. y55x31]|uniref:hypothetical protein n=1 Tax=Polyangium sp. y55x31 TaxID=3042688 RepID=UPI0024830270|nr:hypothetical protein [Polyangium sp. y55x31]MDI1483166.1 hypothetical protein [Polyangium sp. y55x31]